MNAERLKDYNFLKSKTIDEIYSLFDGLSALHFLVGSK